MPSSCKSSVISSPTPNNLKPMNVFFIWYAELCRRSNINPLPSVKPPKPKNDAVLDFNADRIRPDDWTPIINALRLDTSLHVIAIKCRMVGIKFLYDINTEDKIRQLKRRCAFLWTDYILKSLIRSLNCCIRNTQVLSTLELDGLPLSGEYFELLLQTLKHNRSIKVLSLAHCPITDVGCEQLCVQLRFIPNLEVLNVSSCSLGVSSAISIAKIIKHQQLNRYCETWHNSLRYEDPNVGIMAGLKRITLNNNPNVGDDGLSLILNELDDDLWIKALDMQKCNITEKMSTRLIELVQVSKSLIIADFRNNEKLSRATLERILDIIEKKHRFGMESEYQWCGTTTTLFDFGCCDSSPSIISGLSSHIQKSQSAPIGQINFGIPGSKVELRRTKTVTMLDRKFKHNVFFSNPHTVSKRELEYAKKQLININAKLQLEVTKRKQTEKKNFELQLKLKDLEKQGDLNPCTRMGIQSTTPSKSGIEICAVKISKKDYILNKKNLKLKLAKDKTKCDNNPRKTRKISYLNPIMPKNRKQHLIQPASSPISATTLTLEAHSLLEQYLNNNRTEENEEEHELGNFLSYFYDKDMDKSEYPNKTQIEPSDKNNNDNNYCLNSESDASLEHFLLEISQDNCRPAKETKETSCKSVAVYQDLFHKLLKVG